jgi:hypothetical protein
MILEKLDFSDTEIGTLTQGGTKELDRISQALKVNSQGV